MATRTRRPAPKFIVAPAFEGRPFQVAWSREDGEYVVLGPHGGVIGWYGPRGYGDAELHANAANTADAEALALDERADEADGRAALAEARMAA
jgi:hypothetical protein